jgi:hypothetical protein
MKIASAMHLRATVPVGGIRVWGGQPPLHYISAPSFAWGEYPVSCYMALVVSILQDVLALEQCSKENENLPT